MRHGGDKRGSNRDRQRRKEWLLSEEAGFGGDGVTVKCTHCPTMCTYETLTVDRKVMGCDAGTYRRDNIQPSCAPCANQQGGLTSLLRQVGIHAR